ncbi:MAG: flagellar basal body-associated FliL family protein [bacterium]
MQKINLKVWHLLLAMIISSLATILIIHSFESRIPGKWIEFRDINLKGEKSSVVHKLDYLDRMILDIPEISLIRGKAKFLPVKEGGKRAYLGYKIDVKIEKFNIPRPEIGKASDISFYFYFEFELVDKDGFVLDKLESKGCTLNPGELNSYQDKTEKNIPFETIKKITSIRPYLIINNYTGREIKREEASNKREEVSYPVYYSLDPIIATIKSTYGSRFLKINIQLEINSEEVESEISKKKPVILDGFKMALSEKTGKELLTKEGKNKLKADLLEFINKNLSSGKISNILFTDLIMQ